MTETYELFSWDKGFEKFQTVRINVPGDGNCLIHALLLAFYKSYIEENIGGHKISRSNIVKSFRYELAETLKKHTFKGDTSLINPDDNTTVYDRLNNGFFKNNANEVHEYSLKEMYETLDSSCFLGYVHIPYICDVIQKDVIFIDHNTRDVYKMGFERDEITGDIQSSLIKNRDTIVLYYYDDSHYDLVGLKNSDDKISTLFKPENEFIKFLKSRC